MGAWIETHVVAWATLLSMSHPLWVRGLKRGVTKKVKSPYLVAPLVGAWIETERRLLSWCADVVAPLVGAWIETGDISKLCCSMMVAPLVGAWIETKKRIKGLSTKLRRTPCGCVD